MEDLVATFGQSVSGLAALLPVAVLAAVAAGLEMRFPKRAKPGDGLRWATSAALMLAGLALVTLVLPVTGVLMAGRMDATGGGLMNWIGLWEPAAVLIGFLIFDAMLYALHRASHEIPLLWRLHRTHHSDAEVDASTAIRHHPLELFLTAGVGVIVVAVFAVPALSILLHYAAAQSFAFWQHANIRSFRGQRQLSALFVVPELHEVHHGAEDRFHNTNYGVVLSVWDRWFGTLTDDPKLAGSFPYGLQRDYWDHPSTLGSLLIDPVRK